MLHHTLPEVPVGRDVNRHLGRTDAPVRNKKQLPDVREAEGVPLPDVREDGQDAPGQGARGFPVRILRGRPFNPGDKKPIEAEERMEDVKFNVFKFTDREKPSDKKQVIIVTNFSEFGCESIALMYCIPRVLKMYPGSYIIAAGWYGREYLYRHLVDEFWEIKEEHQWLREYSRAFSHESKNLDRIEKGLANFGQVLSGSYFGHICLGNTCRACKTFWGDEKYVACCVKCGSIDVERSVFGDIPFYKPQAVHIPRPTGVAVERAKKLLEGSRCTTQSGAKTVGIFARGRTCYGRNLPPEFYGKLIDQLDGYGYKVVWLGEKQSTIPVPKDHAHHVLDFSRMPESRDLELTLAIISQCAFTVQFWTASTRFAAMMGVPWILFESPDQIVGQGQEGMRIALTTENDKKKLILSHYLNVLGDHAGALSLVERAVREMFADDWRDIVGMVEDRALVEAMLVKKQQWGSN